MLSDTRIVLVNIYAPNDINQQIFFFKELQNRLQKYAEELIIIGGDFNCTLGELDKKKGSIETPESSQLSTKSTNYVTCMS